MKKKLVPFREKLKKIFTALVVGVGVAFIGIDNRPRFYGTTRRRA